MNLQQLRYVCAVADAALNISRAAERLHTSQPGISKQIRLLETELGVELFLRKGKHLSELTPVGRQILEQAQVLLQKADVIRQTAAEAQDESRGNLRIATTHTQSRYSLPPVITRFVQKFPGVVLHMQQGTPVQIAELAAKGETDFAIATEALAQFDNLVMLPCFRWNRVVLVPRKHPLANVASKSNKKPGKLTLQQIAQYPLVTYVHGFTGREKLDQAFAAEGLQPNIVFTAADADVIKTYVRLGMGIGITASMAVEKERDSDLVAIDASHLFAWSTTSIGFRRESHLRGYMLAFITLFAPHLTRPLIEKFINATDNAACDKLTAKLAIPEFYLG